MCDPPESTHPFQNQPLFLTNLYVRPSQNLPIPSRINPPFQPICMCDPPRITPPPPREYNPFLTNLYVRPSQNLPIPSRINPSF